MPTIQNLRVAYRMVFGCAFLLFGFGLQYGEIFSRAAARGSAGSFSYLGVSMAFTFAGLFGVLVAAALRLIVGHIEALEVALEKLVEKDDSPDSASLELREFLRLVKPAKKGRWL